MNAIVGNPLIHSLSPILHNEIYRQLGVVSSLVKDESRDIEELVGRIRTESYELTAVTIPHKQVIIKYLDEVDEVAQKIGAVNTVINKNGKLYGHNTDIVGIKKALAGVQIKNKNILILGAGGVARSVAYYISRSGGKALFNSRTRRKAEELATEFGGRMVELEDLKKNEIDVIINTTPVGMYPQVDEMSINKELLIADQVVFDIVYNPVKTKLLQEAEKAGAKIISGLDMFIYQGIEQICLWQEKDIEVDLDSIRNLLIGQL